MVCFDPSSVTENREDRDTVVVSIGGGFEPFLRTVVVSIGGGLDDRWRIGGGFDRWRIDRW